MTQQALAEGIHRTIENGVREGRPVMLRDIARVLRVSVEDLTRWTKPTL